MRKYERLEVWDTVEADSGVRLNVFPPNDVLSIKLQERTDGRDKLVATVRRSSTIWSSVSSRRVIRVVDEVLGFSEWRISKILQEDSAAGGLVGVIEAESIRQDLLDGVLEDTLDNNSIIYEFEIAQTPANLIANFILAAAKSYFAAGVIDPTDVITLTTEWDSPLSALQQIAKETNSRLAIRRNGTTNYLIDLLIDATPANPSSEIRTGKNVIGVKHETKVDKLATRVYPRGEAIEEIYLTMAEAVWKVVSISTLDVVLVDPNSSNGPIAFDDQFNGKYLEKTDGTYVEITDTIFSSQIVVVSSGTGISADDLVKIRLNSSGDQLTYLDSPADQVSLGVVPRVLDRSDIPHVQNLVANPQLSGAYSAGVAPNWNKINTGTAAENVNALYHRRDSKSQKFSGTLDGEGIQSDAITIVPTENSPHFSAYFTLWIKEGRVRFEWYDVTNDKPILSGSEGKNHSSEVGVWVDFGLAGVDLFKEGTTSVKLSIVIDGDQTTEFYLDSAQLTRSAGHLPFFAGDGAVKLWLAANDELIVRGTPETVVTVNIVDLFRLNPTAWPYDELILMDPIRIIDDDMSVNVITRIVELQHSVLEDGVVSVGLSDKPEDMTDIMFRTRRRVRVNPTVNPRFDDPRTADPSIGPEQVNVTTITYPIAFDPETSRIEVYTREAVTSAVPVPGELGMYRASTVLPGAANFVIEGTSNYYRRTLFVAYDKNNHRGKTVSFGPTQMVDTGAGPSGSPSSLAAGTPTTTTMPLTWTNSDVTAQTRIYRDGVVVHTVGPGIAAWTNDSLSPDTEYNWQLDHYKNDQPSGKSNLIVESTDALPDPLSPPTSFTATCDESTGMEFSWLNGDPSAHTVIERADNVGFTVGDIELITVNPGVTFATDDLEPSGEYWFRAYHTKSGYDDSAPTAAVDASYFCSEA